MLTGSMTSFLFIHLFLFVCCVRNKLTKNNLTSQKCEVWSVRRRGTGCNITALSNILPLLRWNTRSQNLMGVFLWRRKMRAGETLCTFTFVRLVGFWTVTIKRSVPHPRCDEIFWSPPPKNMFLWVTAFTSFSVLNETSICFSRWLQLFSFPSEN